jgi:hypothetical protein
MANKYDYPNICGLLWSSGNGRRVGTGFLIGPHHVLTVGHNLFDPSVNPFPHNSQGVTAYFPGTGPGDGPIVVPTTAIDVHPRWRKDAFLSNRHLSAYDFGIAVLRDEPPLRSFALAEPDQPERLAVVGYPKEASVPGLFQWIGAFNQGRVECPDPNYSYRLYYPPMYLPPNRIEGMSGAPAYLIDANGMPIRDTNGRVIAVGVQSSWVGFPGGPLASAVAIYENEILPVIRGWLEL